MYQIKYDQPVHIHFIGIGGISMSGLAAVLLRRGFTVSGSDARQSPMTSTSSSTQQPSIRTTRNLPQ